MKELSWIRPVRTNKAGIPVFAHPDGDEIPVFGSLHVRWPDGSVSQSTVITATVYTIERDGTQKHGLYTYFEVPFNSITVIYNLNEIELRADEVEKCRFALKKTGKAA